MRLSLRRASKAYNWQAMLALTVTPTQCEIHQLLHHCQLRAEILRTVVGRRHDFKLIITSATMDADKFAA